MSGPVAPVNKPVPAALIGVIEAALSLIVAGHLLNLTHEQVGLVMAVVSAVGAVYVAMRTHQMTLALVIGAINATAALGVGFGYSLTPEVTAGIIALVTAAAGLFNHAYATPKGSHALAA